MTQRTRIKMCGTTRIEDAQKAVELGIDAIGFIFAKKSPRFISPEFAIEIMKKLPPFLSKVGVFVNEGQQEIEEIVRYLGLNGVQLHGNESPEFCERIISAVPSCSVMKAFRVGDHSRPEDFATYKGVTHGFLLDTYVKDKEGGTGQIFDWNILEKLQLGKPYILAGGLNAENVKKALEIISPFALDVNSGVEHSPGVKDHEKLERFVKNVKLFDDLN